MPKLFEELIERLLSTLLNKAIFVCLIGSMVVSFVGVFLLGLLIGVIGGWKNTFPWIDVNDNTFEAPLLGVLFTIIWFALSAITYWLVTKQFEDIYARLRSRLVGTWGLKLGNYTLDSRFDLWDMQLP